MLLYFRWKIGKINIIFIINLTLLFKCSHTIIKAYLIQKYFHPTITLIFMRFKREKYIDLILYILSQTCTKRSFGKTMLCSLLYFIDFNYYELYSESITNEKYIKSKRGIKPIHFREIIQELISNNYLFFRKEPYYNRVIHKYYPIIIPNTKFSSQELEIINYSINKLINNNASSITRYAIKDPPIIIANFGEEIDFRYVFSRNHKYSIIDK